MGTAFDTAFRWILEAEGVDADDPADPGGRTRYGISQAAHPDVDVPHLTLEQARAIYLEQYWHPVADGLPDALGFVVFDAAVQHGCVDALRMLQQALRARLKIDGVLGPKTIAAALRAGAQRRTLLLVLNRFLAIRGAYYCHLVAMTPKLERFHHGWLVRLFRVHGLALSLPERRDGGAATQGGDGPRPSPLAATGPASPSGRPGTEDR